MRTSKPPVLMQHNATSTHTTNQVKLLLKPVWSSEDRAKFNEVRRANGEDLLQTFRTLASQLAVYNELTMRVAAAAALIEAELFDSFERFGDPSVDPAMMHYNNVEPLFQAWRSEQYDRWLAMQPKGAA